MIDEKKLRDLQVIAMQRIDELLLNIDYKLVTSEKEFIWNKKNNYEVVLEYRLKKLTLKFWLYYDQVEYSILDQENNELAHCIIEDYAEIDEMLESFFSYLQSDMEKYKVMY